MRQALRNFRHAAGISQEALADLAGIHRTYVGDVERGERNVSLLNMVRLSAALGTPLSQVVGLRECTAVVSAARWPRPLTTLT